MKVYKYRGIDTIQRDILTLSENKIFASPFIQLNDPFEGVYNEQISMIVSLIEKVFNANGDLVKSRFNNILNYKSKLGIYSLCKCYKNELLWSHYANAHKGFCIEYDLQGLKENYLNPLTVHGLNIDYKKSPQKIIPTDFNKKDLFLRKLFATKSKEWKYENEIRLIYDTSGLKDYKPASLTGIYFGVDMDEINKKLIMNSLINYNVKFYDIIREERSFKLNRKLSQNFLDLQPKTK